MQLLNVVGFVFIPGTYMYFVGSRYYQFTILSGGAWKQNMEVYVGANGYHMSESNWRKVHVEYLFIELDETQHILSIC